MYIIIAVISQQHYNEKRVISHQFAKRFIEGNQISDLISQKVTTGERELLTG